MNIIIQGMDLAQRYISDRRPFEADKKNYNIN